MFAWQPEWTALDAGCGPGTLSLPLARRVKAVTALDFSTSMLKELTTEQQRQGLRNISVIQAAWEDDWSAAGIVPHDVMIASRSLAVDDLQGALTKIDHYARKLAIIGDRVGAGPFDPGLFAALGRSFVPGPDYIFTLNILHRLGIYAKVDFITLQHQRIPDYEQALNSLLWMIPTDQPLTTEEEKRLKLYVTARLRPRPDGAWLLLRDTPSKWAVISWAKTGNDKSCEL